MRDEGGEKELRRILHHHPMPDPPWTVSFETIAQMARRRRIQRYRIIGAAAPLTVAVAVAAAVIIASNFGPETSDGQTAGSPTSATSPISSSEAAPGSPSPSISGATSIPDDPGWSWHPVDPASVKPPISRERMAAIFASNDWASALRTSNTSTTFSLAKFSSSVVVVGPSGKLEPSASGDLAWVVAMSDVASGGGSRPLPVPSRTGLSPSPAPQTRTERCSFYAVYSAIDGHLFGEERGCEGT